MLKTKSFSLGSRTATKKRAASRLPFEQRDACHPLLHPPMIATTTRESTCMDRTYRHNYGTFPVAVQLRLMIAALLVIDVTLRPLPLGTMLVLYQVANVPSPAKLARPSPLRLQAGSTVGNPPRTWGSAATGNRQKTTAIPHAKPLPSRSKIGSPTKRRRVLTGNTFEVTMTKRTRQLIHLPG